jgi:hypothetical protein
MYSRISNQTESLKGLWAAKMNLKGKAALATDEDLASYERKLEALEIELERRRDVGRRFEAVLDRQVKLMEEDEQCREKHQVSDVEDRFSVDENGYNEMNINSALCVDLIDCRG